MLSPSAPPAVLRLARSDDGSRVKAYGSFLPLPDEPLPVAPPPLAPADVPSADVSAVDAPETPYGFKGSTDPRGVRPSLPANALPPGSAPVDPPAPLRAGPP